MTFHSRYSAQLLLSRRHLFNLNNYQYGFVQFNKHYSSNSVIMSFTKYDQVSSDSESKKPPLVIMHGLFGSKSNWNSLSKALNRSTKRTVYAVDARNHGNSPHSEEFSYDLLANDIEQFISSISDGVCFMGHSMGGRAAMHFSLKRPELLEKLIVVDISPISTSKDLNRMSIYFDIMRKVKIDKSLPMSEARRLAAKQMLPSIKSETIVSFLLTNFIVSEDGSYKWRINLDSLEKHFKSGALDFPVSSGRFTKPTLFIAGTKSDYLTKNDEGSILEIFPQSKFVYLNAGHWVHAEDPVGLITNVTAFLKD